LSSGPPRPRRPVFNIGALSVNDNIFKFNSFGTVAVATSFNDEYDFTVLAPAKLLDAQAHNFNTPAHQNILGLHIDLKDGASQIATSGFGTGGVNDDVEIPATVVAPGHNYRIFVTENIRRTTRLPMILTSSPPGFRSSRPGR